MRRNSIENHGASERIAQLVIPEAVEFHNHVCRAGAAAHVIELKAYLKRKVGEVRSDVLRDIQQGEVTNAQVRAAFEHDDMLVPVELEGSDSGIPMIAFTFPPCRRHRIWEYMLDRHDVAIVVARLREDIECPARTPDPAFRYFLRVCPSWFNTQRDLDQLADGLRALFGVDGPSDAFA